MASIINRGKSYSIVYYEGEGKNRHRCGNVALVSLRVKPGKSSLKR